MELRYIIMARYPFPGRWELLPTCHLQAAELATFKGDRFYHQRAARITPPPSYPTIWAYSRDDATALLDTLRRGASTTRAEYHLTGIITR